MRNRTIRDRLPRVFSHVKIYPKEYEFIQTIDDGYAYVIIHIDEHLQLINMEDTDGKIVSVNAGIL